jgi:hypothetical protein
LELIFLPWRGFLTAEKLKPGFIAPVGVVMTLENLIAVVATWPLGAILVGLMLLSICWIYVIILGWADFRARCFR